MRVYFSSHLYGFFFTIVIPFAAVELLVIYTSANRSQNWEHYFQPSSVHLTVTVGKDKSSQRRLFILMGRDNKNHRGFPFWPGWNFKRWKRVIFILYFN